MSWAEQNSGRYEHARTRHPRARAPPAPYDSVLHSYFSTKVHGGKPGEYTRRGTKSSNSNQVLVLGNSSHVDLYILKFSGVKQINLFE
jgi:hypothetical protein